ncbi:MAG: hypothetical protein CL677_05550 [Bdellovibrionaceae bacterium]|nr:hypothetical protein [Pseudobdellovibrionaceae bacterium]|tara:strand:- start:81094 stop:81894 length:801 start_codon:yes stop_codon:yes gene_type:complete
MTLKTYSLSFALVLSMLANAQAEMPVAQELEFLPLVANTSQDRVLATVCMKSDVMDPVDLEFENGAIFQVPNCAKGVHLVEGFVDKVDGQEESTWFYKNVYSDTVGSTYRNNESAINDVVEAYKMISGVFDDAEGVDLDDELEDSYYMVISPPVLGYVLGSSLTGGCSDPNAIGPSCSQDNVGNKASGAVGSVVSTVVLEIPAIIGAILNVPYSFVKSAVAYFEEGHEEKVEAGIKSASTENSVEVETFQISSKKFEKVLSHLKDQ